VVALVSDLFIFCKLQLACGGTHWAGLHDLFVEAMTTVNELRDELLYDSSLGVQL
jgi:hypothetical protein